MKQLHKRLTYANVMSSIAVFLVLGGATALAAGQLGKNSVGSKQLKKNAVTTAKIKKNAVTGAKIKNGTITGSKLNLGSIGTVPSATHAGSADSAGNADTVGGIHLAKISYVASENSPKQTIYSANGLTLYAECNGAEDLDLTATTSSDNSEIYESGNYTTTYEGNYDDDFDIGDVEKVGENIGDNTQEEVQGQLVYSTSSGAIVTASFSLNDSEQGHGGTQDCNVQGIAQAS